jgi:hypothetical protein
MHKECTASVLSKMQHAKCMRGHFNCASYNDKWILVLLNDASSSHDDACTYQLPTTTTALKEIHEPMKSDGYTQEQLDELSHKWKLLVAPA